MNDDDITAGDHERRPTPATIEIYEPWRERYCPPDVPVGAAVVEVQYRRPAVVGWNTYPESKLGAHIGVNDPLNGTPFGSRTPSMLRLPDRVDLRLPATVTYVGTDAVGRAVHLVTRDEESGALWPWLRQPFLEGDAWMEPMHLIGPVTKDKHGVPAPSRGSFAHYVFQPWMPNWLGPNESDVDFQNRDAHTGPHWRRMMLKHAFASARFTAEEVGGLARAHARVILGKRPTP